MVVASVACGPRRGSVQGGDSDGVVDLGGHLERGPVSVLAAVVELAAGADGLDPSEGFFDAFALALAHLVTDVTCGVRVNGGSPVGGVLRDVRGEPPKTLIRDGGARRAGRWVSSGRVLHDPILVDDAYRSDACQRQRHRSVYRGHAGSNPPR